MELIIPHTLHIPQVCGILVFNTAQVVQTTQGKQAMNQAINKVVPPTIPASRIPEVLAENLGSRHDALMGMITAPPTNPCAVFRIVAYVEKPKPLVIACNKPLTVDVTEAEDGLISFLRTGERPEPPREATEEQLVQWEADQAKLRRKLKNYLRGMK
jgi:hypothetical protein